MKFTKKDLGFSMATGLITGIIGWRIFVFLGKPEIYGASSTWFILLIPALWIIGVNLGYFLGRWFNFFNQFGKFAAIGFTNALVDFGILDLLIAKTGHEAGIWYSVFKSISFIGAMLQSYIWNKYWAFDAGKSRGGWTEFFKFISVSVSSFIINVLAASVVVNFIHPILSITPKGWAQVGAIVGSAVALIFSFVGFKLAVFRKSANK